MGEFRWMECGVVQRHMACGAMTTTPRFNRSIVWPRIFQVQPKWFLPVAPRRGAGIQGQRRIGGSGHWGPPPHTLKTDTCSLTEHKASFCSTFPSKLVCGTPGVHDVSFFLTFSAILRQQFFFCIHGNNLFIFSPLSAFWYFKSPQTSWLKCATQQATFNTCPVSPNVPSLLFQICVGNSHVLATSTCSQSLFSLRLIIL